MLLWFSLLSPLTNAMSERACRRADFSGASGCLYFFSRLRATLLRYRCEVPVSGVIERGADLRLFRMTKVSRGTIDLYIAKFLATDAGKTSISMAMNSPVFPFAVHGFIGRAASGLSMRAKLHRQGTPAAHADGSDTLMDGYSRSRAAGIGKEGRCRRPLPVGWINLCPGSDMGSDCRLF
jgi:hypothetical protein